jgi:MYXO-CTERM domain-containing protein
VWRPKVVAPGTRLPNVVIETGSVQAPETLYWFLAQRYVRAGYAVLTFDVRGQGRSDNHTPGGAQGSNANSAVFWDGLVDAISFFRSSAAHPYAHDLPTALPGGCGGTTPTVVAPANPIADVLDPARLGIVGHSLGATGVSTVQSYDAPGQPTWLAGGGQPDLDATNPVKAVVALDSLTTAAPRVPALTMSSEYGLTPVPFTTQPAANGRDGGFAAYQAAGVPAMSVTLRGSTHYEFSKIPTFPSTSWRYGGPVVEQLSTAWLDRWLKLPGEPGYDDADARLLDDAGKVYAGVKAGDPAESLCDRLSIYFSASRSFPTRDGGQAATPDLQDACAATVTPVVPEAPAVPLLALGAAGALGLAVVRRRRRSLTG